MGHYSFSVFGSPTRHALSFRVFHNQYPSIIEPFNFNGCNTHIIFSAMLRERSLQFEWIIQWPSRVNLQETMKTIAIIEKGIYCSFINGIPRLCKSMLLFVLWCLAVLSPSSYHHHQHNYHWHNQSWRWFCWMSTNGTLLILQLLRNINYAKS